MPSVPAFQDAADPLMEAESEIQPPRPTPKASVTPKADLRAKPSPKPTPKKTVVSKASPAVSPKPIAPTAQKKKLAQSIPAKKESTESGVASPQPIVRNGSATQAGETNPGVGQGSRAGSESLFAWYGKMLHDRFYSEWVQPTSVVASSNKMSTLVKIRIEKDGRISDFAIVRSSGNLLLDESVTAVATRVTRVDPLPDGLGNGPYERKINFELEPR